MTDEEIIKALECCVESDCKNCAENCGSAMCLRNLVKDSADLIIRQKAEVEELEIELQAMRNAANGYKAEFERLMPFDYQVEVSKKIEQEIKSEAIKEFAERLKEKFGIADCIVTIDNNDIDNLLKEMEEQENDRA